MSENWLQTLKDTGALWKHRDEVGGPHAIWTTGLHSDSYINMARVTERPDFLSIMCENLIKKVRDEKLLNDSSMPSWVVGPAMGSIAVAYECARQLNCMAGFTEKIDEEMQLRRFFIEPNSPILAIDDTMSTGSSVTKTVSCLIDMGLSVLPFVLVIANYSGKKDLKIKGKTYTIISLVEFEFNAQMWKPEECPLCKKGSEALRPKENWNKFK